ncbi:DUF5694 domain-containing protein [Gynurincola endophyticus]|uniref:DUF5694 domain-containing protein n=1 Tax=Gynurincola endophyticus TaxID=2479004 RepID=UPI000F8D1699|nr:DUF5694 domain-containing protein [Gynurincola endophyticus]
MSSSLKAQHIADPDSILIGNRKQPTVLLVGTFHFAYYNLDAHKTTKDRQVDVMNNERQLQINELIDYIARFKPTKIAVEAGRNTGYLMRKYDAYKEGSRQLAKDEIEQIGFRLMKRFHLDTIYGTNDQPLVHSLANSKDSLLLRPILDSIYKDWDFRNNDTITQLYYRYFNYVDEMKLKTPLLDIFRYQNSDKVLNRGYGINLVGDFTLGDTRGADALAMHWYSRNLRIYRHIQQIATSPDDRILVLYGQGHIQILKQLFECSPEFQLIKFNDL